MPPSPRTRLSQEAYATFAPKPGHRHSLYSITAIPSGQYLLVTTADGLYSWDASGVRKIFNSSKKGILAAKASKDGNQVLAVADSNVVVLHDCKRGREQSWGLNGSDGQVRLLEYAPDAKSLYLSTSLTGAIQCYSMHESRMLDPAQTHPSPPTVLAVNATGQLLISASESPSVVYLQNLTLGTSAMHLFPSVSTAPVVVAAFHPERPNIFMLAFKDGSLAAYDATKMARRNGTRMDVNTSRDRDGVAGELGRFGRLHRITNQETLDKDWTNEKCGPVSEQDLIGPKSVGITGATFLPGHKSRAVSVGGDGRCRIVDFENGGQILRTWHAQAPITSVAILSSIERAAAREPGKSSTSSKASRKTTITETTSLIAVGRRDGKVMLFDPVGLKLADVVVSHHGETILGLEWVKGPTPESIIDEEALPHRSHRQSYQTLGCIPQRTPNARNPTSMSETVIAEPMTITAIPVTSLGRQSIPPVQVEEHGTVIRTEAPPVDRTSVPRAIEFSANYLDLFSPVKERPKESKQADRGAPNSALRTRPRLSSTTFAPKDHSSDDVSPKTATDPSRSVTFTESTRSESSSLTHRRPAKHLTAPATARKLAASPKKRAATIMITPGHMVSSSSGSSTTSGSISADTRNGQILADLRRLGLGAKERQQRKSGNKALFASYMNRTAASNIRRRSQGRSMPSKDDSTPRALRSRPSSHALASTDSTCEEVGDIGDIWITEGSDAENVAKSRRHRPARPQFQSRPQPAKPNTTPPNYPQPQASSGPKKRLSDHPAPPPLPLASHPIKIVHTPSPNRPAPPPPLIQRFLHSQGPAQTNPTITSSDEAPYMTARDHFSGVDGTLSPQSEEIRRLCPRTSSLWPEKGSSSQKSKSSRTSSARTVLRELDGEGVNVRLPQIQAQEVRKGKGKREEKGRRRQKDAVVIYEDWRPNPGHRNQTTETKAKNGNGDGGVEVEEKGAKTLDREIRRALAKAASEAEGRSMRFEQREKHEKKEKEMGEKEMGETCCDGCADCRAEIRELKDELAKVRAQVLGMKAALRRAGIGMPAGTGL